MYGDIDLGTCIWCQERSVRCSIAQGGKGSGKVRKQARADKGKQREKVDEEAEDESEDEGCLQKKARTENEGGVETLGKQMTEVRAKANPGVEVEVRAEVSPEVWEEGEVPREELAHLEPQASSPEDGAALVIEVIRELTEVCRRGFDDMREELAGLWEDRALFRRVTEDYL